MLESFFRYVGHFDIGIPVHKWQGKLSIQGVFARALQNILSSSGLEMLLLYFPSLRLI